MINIDKLNKMELLALIEQAEIKIEEMDKQEAIKEKSQVIIQVGKTYETKNGDKIIIVSKNISIYTGLNKTYTGKSINEKYPEYYINGRRSKNKLSDGDLIKEINNG